MHCLDRPFDRTNTFEMIMGNSEEQLTKMINRQIVARGLSEPRLIAALRSVPRELFLPESLRAHAYEDRAVEIGNGQTISQPYVVALMTHALKLTGTERVLEIGVGSGYGAAILSQMASEYYGVEILDELLDRAKLVLGRLNIRNASFKIGDGNFGWPEKAPFDAVSVTAAAKVIPPPLIDQLAIGGRLVIPVCGSQGEQSLLRITRCANGQWTRENLGAVAFVPFVGSEKWNYLS
jgi:protein-L-isoaspartate(D-aspartate) O-methyltransferase